MTWPAWKVPKPRWQLHVRFVRDTGLAPHAGKREIDRNYLVPDRRFLFGTLSWQQNVAGFGYEFWEGDRLTAPLLREAGVDRDVRGRPGASDHAPAWIELDLPAPSRQ